MATVRRARWWAPVLVSALLVSMVPIGARAAGPSGSWEPVSDWPLLAIHSILTPSGDVLTFGTDAAGQQTGRFIYDVWDPSGSAEAGHSTLPNSTQTDLFCATQTVLADSGETLLVGGDVYNFALGKTSNNGTADVVSVSPDGRTLTQETAMHRDRWYATVTAMPNGTQFVQGGRGLAGVPDAGGELRPEVRLANGEWQLAAIDTDELNWSYPRNFVAPDGRIFGFDLEGRMYYVDAGFSQLTRVGNLAVQNQGDGSSPVMFQPGRILQWGGNSLQAVIIDINGATPVVTRTANISQSRHWGNATVLPDGKVLATGGSARRNELVGVALTAELWDPATGTWTVDAAAQLPRLYHSTALLLPDGRVLVAGGGAPGPVTNTNAEIYSPPYLFDEAGGPAVRLEIESAPGSVAHGDSLALAVDRPDDVARVTIVRTGAVTHSFNVDQRFVELDFAHTATGVSAEVPVDVNQVTPGYYLVTVIDEDGVPSVSEIVLVEQPPVPPGPYGPLVGGLGGTPFADSAGTGAITGFDVYVDGALEGLRTYRAGVAGSGRGDVDGAVTPVRFQPTERLVRVFGTADAAGTKVASIGFETDQGTVYGPYGSGTGDAFDLEVPAGHQVSGVRGRASTVIDSIGIETAPTVVVGGVPVVGGVADQVSVVGDVVSVGVSASDPDGDVLVFSAVGLPGGVVMDAGSGVMSGTVSVAGVFDVTVSVSDGVSSVSTGFVWSVGGGGDDVYGDVVGGDGPAVWWRLGDGVGSLVADDVVGVVDGSFVGGPGLGAGSLVGGPDSAVVFDGVDDGVAVPDSVRVNTATRTGFSIEAWVKPADAGGGRQVVFEQGGTSRGASVYVQGGLLYGGMWNTPDDGPDTPWVSGPAFVSAPVVDGGVYHVVLTLDQPNGVVRLFVNGVEVGSVSGVGTLYSHGADVGIGVMREGSRFHTGPVSGEGSRFVGTIDEVAIYSSPLDQATITDHHQAGN